MVKNPGNRSQVLSSKFRVKEKKAEVVVKMLILLNNYQFGSKFWIRPDEADALS
jgi:hypothetical protein